MFITVRYGEDKSRIFNAHCRNDLLLKTIKAKCECGENDVVDLSDEHGVVKNLRNFPSEYGSDFLKERETLILLRVNNTCHRKVMFTPLLSSLGNDRGFIDSLHQSVDDDSSDLSPHRRMHPVESEDESKLPRGKGKGNSPNPFALPKRSVSRKITKSFLKK